ncbi:hypothetical protein GGI05_002767, partial [Coemansia sp. RSA 2603]
MSYVLRTRQAVLIAVGLVYVFVLAWFNRQPIPTTTLVHETDNSLRLRSTNTDLLGARNQDMHWIEPARYLPNIGSEDTAAHPPGTVDIDAGLLHIRLHTEYLTMRPNEPLGGLLKVYRKKLLFVKTAVSDSTGSGSDTSAEDAWELLFVDRLPGPVKKSYLDRTRLRNEDGTYAPRKLALLYYMPRNESVTYRTRIYDLETLHQPEYFSSSISKVGESWWELRRNVAKDPQIALQTIKVASMYGLCPDDSIKFADTVYSNAQFGRCVGPAGLLMKTVDFALPGSLE